MASSGFHGWPTAAFDFFRGLEADNSKRYWTANKAVYDEAVREPMNRLCAELTPMYGPFHIFRPNRDVRFSRDKSPYKTAVSAVTEGRGGEGYYVQFSLDGVMAGSGYYRMATDQLTRYREAVDENRAGKRLAMLLADVTDQGFEVGGEALKTAPRGFPRDHPRVQLLRHKGVTVGRTYPSAKWIGTRGCLSRITAVWDASAEVNRWLNRHVGPSTLPPET